MKKIQTMVQSLDPIILDVITTMSLSCVFSVVSSLNPSTLYSILHFTLRGARVSSICMRYLKLRQSRTMFTESMSSDKFMKVWVLNRM